MAFSSKLYAGEVILHDTTPGDVHATPGGYSTGLRLDLRNVGYGAIPGAPPFPTELDIDPSEYQARIQEIEETESRISDWCMKFDLPCKDQNGTNLCWSNAPVHAMEILRLMQNQQKVIFSPASVAGPINGFRNEGGWGGQALQQIVNHGAVPVDKWPANAIDRRYYTEENKALAKEFVVTEWMELVPRNMRQVMSCLLRRIPIAVGLNWWGHEVTYCDPVWLDGQAVVRIRNSWGMGWGSNGGFSILQGSRMYADDAVAPRVATAS